VRVLSLLDEVDFPETSRKFRLIRQQAA